ncbi:MAG: hypothetical protein ABF326_10995 [Arenicellales bacterium]
MKMIKRLLTPFLFMPVAGFAHPGHEHEGVHSSFTHILGGTEPHFIFLGLALLAFAAVWLVKQR